MNSTLPHLPRAGALLAINLLFLTIWGFAGVGKLIDGMPPWFGDKFGQTILAKFPGLAVTFWLLTSAEFAAFGLAAVALARGEFLRRTSPVFLTAMLVWSLFVFLQLSFGQWLTSEFNGTVQQFTYFTGTLFTLFFVNSNMPATRSASESQRSGEGVG